MAQHEPTTSPRTIPVQQIGDVRLLYCPVTPHPRQIEFLLRPEREVLFGGAAGGGKSSALLMAALQYVDQPGYAALILRKDTQRLWLAGGLIPRSHEWLAGTDAKWNGVRRQWTFPTAKGPPATLTFGFLDKATDKFRYASSEFQFLGFDELTELREEDYLFLFSRLRRNVLCQAPLRVRGATNPGNVGHLWVKQRFIEGAALVALPADAAERAGKLPELDSLLLRSAALCPGAIYQLDERVFVPSFIADNPSLDAAEYVESLRYLPPVERERLARGDWSVQEQALFRREWFRYFQLLNEQIDLLKPSGEIFVTIPQNECRRFFTVDPAGTADDATSGRCYSVVQAWDQPTRREWRQFLILRGQFRGKVTIGELGRELASFARTWRPEQIFIENEPRGHALQSMLEKEQGLPKLTVELIKTENQKKEVRAVPLENKFHDGEVYLPNSNAEWIHDFERELLSWTGKKHEPADQIDAAAYAAIVANQHRGRVLKVLPVHHRS